MRKIVSRNEYSLFIEKIDDDKIDCVAFMNGMPMKQAEVADQLNMAKSTISTSLRRSINKVYRRIKNENTKLSSVEIMCTMADIFNIKSQKEYQDFFKMFPKKIQGEVYEYARETGFTH